MSQSQRRAFAATYTEPGGRRWLIDEVARLETVTASIDGPSPRLLLRFVSDDSTREQRFTRCGPIRWQCPEIVEALFLAARPATRRVVPRAGRRVAPGNRVGKRAS